jgi:hypothetical protein
MGAREYHKRHLRVGRNRVKLDWAGVDYNGVMYHLSCNPA